MAADRSYVEKNRGQLDRLRALVQSVSDDDLAHPMPAGWTVAMVLAHAAFWDYRIVAQLDLWGPDGAGPRPRYDEAAVDWINDATKLIFAAMPPRLAARIAVEAAEVTDQRVADLSDELLAKNEATGSMINLVRAEHRQEHLDEIEQVLGRR